jgi:hypothetical protein
MGKPHFLVGQKQIYRTAQNKTNARFICEEAGEVKATLRYSEAEAITSALLSQV